MFPATVIVTTPRSLCFHFCASFYSTLYGYFNWFKKTLILSPVSNELFDMKIKCATIRCLDL